MSLVVQNERLLMLGHPDRDDEDLMSVAESNDMEDSSSSESESGSGSESENESDTNNNSGSVEKIHQQSEYFGCDTAEATVKRGSSRRRRHSRKKDNPSNSPSSEEGCRTPQKRVQRRSSAAELRRVRQLLQRAENTTQAVIKARQQQQERLQKEALQQSFLFDRGGIATAPSSPGGRGVRSVFGHHQAHRSKRFSSSPSEPNEHTDDYFRQFGSNSTTPNSSRPNSIHEEQNLETVKSFKSLFSVRSGPKFKPRRSSSLKAECKQGNRKELRDSSGAGNSVHASPSSRTSIDEAHYATLPARLGGAVFEDGSPNQRHSPHSGLKFKAPLSEYQMKKAAEAYRKQREKEARREHKRAEKEAKIEQQLLESQRQAEAAARAIPPKEVAFGDRKLFMSFLNIVRDPLQRLSDTCSRVMFSLERELVAGLNVEQDRLERIKRRNAQHAAAIRATEAILAEEEKAAAIGATADAKTADPANNEAVGIEKSGSDVINKKADSKTRILDRIRTLIGIDTPHLTKDDIDYVKALKSGMNMNKEKNTKLPKKVPIDTPHPNKFLQKDAQRNAAFSGLDDEDDLALPPGVSYVQYLTQELEIFDKAEAESLRDFISTHPTLEVGPREELFLIFFFLFALREIARELLRLGKYLEEQEEKVRARMETEHHIKRRKKLWWPKVVGNFWRWFAWGNYNQVKTSEGYNSLILNSAKNLEHRQLMSVEEEKAHVEAKAAKAAAEKAAAEAAAKAALERQAAAHRRRHSETWNLQPLRRRATVSALVHRGRQSPDVEKGLGSESYATEAHPQRPSLREKSHEPRSRSASPIHSSSGKYRHEHRQHARAGHQPFSRALKKPKSEVGLEDPNVLGVKEVLNRDFGEDDVASPSGATLEAPLTDIKNKSSLAEQYTVVEIPDYESLRHKDDKELKHFEDVNLVELSPRVNTLKPRSTAPPELVTDEATKPKKPVQVIERPSMSHQDRYPSFASSTSPALLHAPDSTTIDSSDAQARCGNPRRSTGDSGDNDSSSTNDRFSRERHYHDHQNKDEQRRSRGIFATFSRRPSEDALELASKERQGPRQAASENEPEKPSGTVFVSVKKPKTLRYRLWELLQPFNSAEYKFGFKMAVALTFIGLWSWLEWNNKPLATDRGQWAMMTVMAVLSPTIGATFSVCAMRVAGTLVGTLWALLTFLALPRNPYVICAMMLIVVIVGIIVSVAMNTLLWPILARRELRKEIAVLIGRQGVLFAELVNKFLLEDPKARRPNHMASWSHYNRHHQGDQEGYNNDGLDERRDPLQDSFIERAERESMNKRQQQARQGDTKPTRNQNLGNDAVSDREGLLYQDEDSRNTMDPDRIAFQHVEQQLQTKLIKISQLLELSALEPRLKEEFPMKLYQQIVQCCQNILDRMVSMRMAAQMLSPEVRELVTGPMNYYRRDMVGALLLYFSVLSSSLAAKSPLPPYLPSARMARLRVIYNVREAIAANRVVTGEDHYTYIYYYAFSSALEEVIEELELLAILIKPLVGVTLVSSGACYTPGTLGDQLNLGSAVATNQLGLPPIPSGATQDAMAQNTAMTPSTMVNIGAADATTAGMGANAFGQPLQYPQDPLYQQQRALEQQQAQQQHRQLQLQLQVHAQHQQIQQQQQQILLQQQQLSMNFHPDLAIPAPSRILINPQIIPVRIAAMNSGDVENPSLNRSDSSSTPSESSEDSHQRPRDETDQRVATRETASVVPGKEPKSKSKSFKAKTGNIHVDISPTTSGTTSISHNLNDLLIPNTTTASALGAPGIIVMDESLLGNRHAQRYKDAVQAAQEASGQQVIEVSSPTLAMFPAQIQLPMCTLSTESYGNGIQRKRSTTTGGIRPSALATGSFKGTDGSGLQSRTKRPSLVPYDSHNSGKSHHHLHPHHPHHGKDHDSSNAHKKDSPSPSAASMITTASPYIPTVTTAIVMPFEYERAPEPVLPLHMIPTLAQSQARQEGQEGQEGQQQQQRQQHD
ncbi:hypothetical protein BCR41DRAFT_375337 [Lobosporangium transversale]|uniref:Uncharacterized protein n=1 Tax=Lobosporangium transversale TaxID=64571 RepID=A0A1Y2G7C8_9FUNG|nr:hypothetical protein BCR41DRAFT_375337 [Lobosporangium transversale]ORY99764.1 hypothetical protein BCR41DRAFT_375337 [Lobosporangium transversale]|eukprot:XP_021875998.1 hypothetical protein BCR41DRAFT_375337 [Lobosporangium transversale]